MTVAPSPELVAHGEELFTHDLTPEQGLGPFINGTACTSCHSSPRVGGMGNNGLATVTRIGRAGPGGFDPMDGQGGPVERVHGVLRTGPQSSAMLCRDVLGLSEAPTLICDRIAVALLGSEPRIRRIPDGRWGLVPEVQGSPLLEECAFAVVDVETTGMRALSRGPSFSSVKQKHSILKK